MATALLVSPVPLTFLSTSKVSPSPGTPVMLAVTPFAVKVSPVVLSYGMAVPAGTDVPSESVTATFDVNVGVGGVAVDAAYVMVILVGIENPVVTLAAEILPLPL